MRRVCFAGLSVALLLVRCASSEAPPESIWSVTGRGLYSARWADVTLTIDPTVGGRITSLQVRNQEMITGPESHPVYYGSTLWLSPQHRWWPEPTAIDTDPYWVQSSGNPLVLMSRRDTVLQVQVKKSFQIVLEDSSLRIEYTAINRADTARSLALWEVTRVQKGCEVGFALDTARSRDIPFPTHSTWSVEDTLYRVSIMPIDTVAQKAFHNATGWVAYSHDSLLLLKRFLNLSLEQLPPRQNEVEVYIDDSAYVEIEQHSPYQSIAPGDSLRWTVQWYPRYATRTRLAELVHQQGSP